MRARIPAWLAVAPTGFLLAWGGNHFTPLLHVYETVGGYAPWQANLLLGMYVVGLVPGMLLAAGLSDRHGRRPIAILGLIADDRLEGSLADLRGMESVLIDTDPAAEAMVPRPDPDEELEDLTGTILDEADDRLFDEYRQQATPSLTAALADGGRDANGVDDGSGDEK